MLTTEQAVGFGLTRDILGRLVATRHWDRLVRGVYLTAPVAPSWDALAWAGVLLGGPGARLGPEASAHLHGLSTPAPQQIDVLVDWERRIGVSGPWRFVRERTGVRGARSVGDPPRLSVEAAVIDLAASLDEDAVIGLVTTAVQKRRSTIARLRAELGGRSRHPHRQLLQGLFADVGEGAESSLEVRFLRDVERPHELPRGDRQQSRAGLGHRTDVDYALFGVLVELDGRVGHEGAGAFRDMNRDNKHALVGRTTLRYGWRDVTTRPCAVAFEIYAVLSDRGWMAPFQRCPLCRSVPEAELAVS